MLSQNRADKCARYAMRDVFYDVTSDVIKLRASCTANGVADFGIMALTCWQYGNVALVLASLLSAASVFGMSFSRGALCLS